MTRHDGAMKWVLMLLGFVFAAIFMIGAVFGLLLLLNSKTILHQGLVVQILSVAITSLLGSAICLGSVIIAEKRAG